ncbi:hypothetical protein ACPV47_24500 [Vibrio jasicida]|uniref:hypothetical protein n=1 Tax=Vibrio jasicida TaxID=766224 RepID=UPI0040698F08
MKQLERIKEKVNKLISDGESDSAIYTFLFSNIRLVLEKKSLKNSYPYLSLVCNWYQHCEIDKSIVGYDVIRQLGELVFDDLKVVGTHKDRYSDLTHSAINAFNFNKLKIELLQFFEKYNVNPVLVSDANWGRTLVGVLYDLIERPIYIMDVGSKKDNKLSKIEKVAKQTTLYLESCAKESGFGDMVIPVGVFIELRENTFYWVLEMKDTIRLSAQLVSVTFSEQ